VGGDFGVAPEELIAEDAVAPWPRRGGGGSGTARSQIYRKTQRGCAAEQQSAKRSMRSRLWRSRRH